MITKLSFHVPGDPQGKGRAKIVRIDGLRTQGGMNAREHYQVRSKRVKAERAAAGWLLATQPKPALPCSVLLTRVAPSAGLDDDNLASALKGVRDEIARWLGVDDRDRMRVRYRYAQRRGAKGEWAVEVTFGEPVAGAQLEITEFA